MAKRFRFAPDRRRYTRAHAALRSILGRALGETPAAVAVRPDRFGKPRIPGAELRFNLSRSGEVALIAVGWQHDVGVDVERIRPLERPLPDVFTAREYEHLVATDASEPLRLWTRKEALLKGTGEGLSTEPRMRDVLDSEFENAWRLVDLLPEDGYVAAVAVDVEIERIVVRRFD
jgi:4'-phosphopantetheinyl transferase